MAYNKTPINHLRTNSLNLNPACGTRSSSGFYMAGHSPKIFQQIVKDQNPACKKCQAILDLKIKQQAIKKAKV